MSVSLENGRLVLLLVVLGERVFTSSLPQGLITLPSLAKLHCFISKINK